MGKHPETRSALLRWHSLLRHARWRSLEDVRSIYRHADQVGHLVVFNVLGGNYRLVVRVNYQRQCVWFKGLFTHAEYDRLELDQWQ